MRKINNEFIKSKEWYHQRFDGCPQLILIISEAELKKEKRKYSWGHVTSHWGYFSNDRADWYIDMDDINRISNKFILLAKKSSDVSRTIIKLWEKDESLFYGYCKKIHNTNLKKLSNNELKDAYNTMLQFGINALSSSSLIDGFALGTDSYIANGLNKALEKSKLSKEASRYFAILTAPVHQSFITQSEIDLLKIGKKIIKNKKILDIVNKEKEITVKKTIKSVPKFYNDLSEHQKKYFWSRNNYVDNNILSIDYFLRELIKMIKRGVNFDKEIKRLIDTPINNKRAKKKLLAKLNLSPVLKNLLIISEDFTWWQDERKKKTYFYTHYLSLILKEIGRRFGYSLHEMKYVFYSEIKDIFESKGKPTNQELQKRIKSCIWQQDQSFKYQSGENAELAFKQVLKKNDISDIDDFRGMTACKGIVKGKVKIVKSVKECNKVKSGDILVAVMTRPDYVSAMKKAAAIITNEGGVTCHAAIVSRELNTPCIIGTKIATEVLKDGDMVEVNANHGVVNILK